jgi:hypothetical protein
MFDEEDYQELPEYPEPYHRQPPQRFYAETLGAVLQSVTEYARTMEHEKSSRADIERKRKTALTVIRSERRVMIEYLSHRFGERRTLYERYFQLVDTALEQQNEEITRLALESVLNVYQDSPCAGLEEFRQQFEAVSEAVRI